MPGCCSPYSSESEPISKFSGICSNNRATSSQTFHPRNIITPSKPEWGLASDPAPQPLLAAGSVSGLQCMLAASNVSPGQFLQTSFVLAGTGIA